MRPLRRLWGRRWHGLRSRQLWLPTSRVLRPASCEWREAGTCWRADSEPLNRPKRRRERGWSWWAAVDRLCCSGSGVRGLAYWRSPRAIRLWASLAPRAQAPGTTAHDHGGEFGATRDGLAGRDNQASRQEDAGAPHQCSGGDPYARWPGSEERRWVLPRMGSLHASCGRRACCSIRGVRQTQLPARASSPDGHRGPLRRRTRVSRPDCRPSP